MKYFARFCKLIFSAEYRENEHLEFGEFFIWILIFALLIAGVVTEVGRQILLILGMIFSVICAFMSAKTIFQIIVKYVRHYCRLKKQWMDEEQEEVTVCVEDEESEDYEECIEEDEYVDDEEVETLASACRAPLYFLDLSALEKYSGRFYAGFLTECFNFDWITKEANAFLITDENTLKALREKENDIANKHIFPGYTAYILRHFKVLTNIDSSSLDNLLKYTEDEDITYVTQNMTFAQFMTEHGVPIILIEQ